MRTTRLGGRFYFSATLFIMIMLFGFLGPLLTSRTPSTVVGGLYDPPSGSAWLGTDNLGHDILTNLVYATRTSLIVGLLAGTAATLIGAVIGSIAGYRSGLTEDVLMAVTNTALTIPAYMVLILIAMALHTRSATGVAIVVAVTTWPWAARAVSVQTSSICTREHMDIARLSGVGSIGLIVFDVIPYLLSYFVMAFVLQVCNAILAEAALSLLGLGESNGVSLGTMLHWALASEALRTGAWWAFVPPTLLLTVMAFSLQALQSSMDELFNPRLRRPRPLRASLPAVALTPAALAGQTSTARRPVAAFGPAGPTPADSVWTEPESSQ